VSAVAWAATKAGASTHTTLLLACRLEGVMTLNSLKLGLLALLVACARRPRDTDAPQRLSPRRDTLPVRLPSGGNQVPAQIAGTLTTDSMVYTARPTGRAGNSTQYAFTVIARLANRGDAPLYVPRCYPTSPGPVYGVQLLDTAATPQPGTANRAAYNRMWGCVGHNNPIEVSPGAVRIDTLRLVGPTMWSGQGGEGIGRVEGRFRLSYQVGVCRRRSDLCRDLPSTWYSNAFAVRVQR
jgi:hypothetical protein